MKRLFLFLTVGFLFLIPSFSRAEIFTDDFESYSDAATIQSQSDWSSFYGQNFYATGNFSLSGSQAVDLGEGVQRDGAYAFANAYEGLFDFYLYWGDNTGSQPLTMGYVGSGGSPWGVTLYEDKFYDTLDQSNLTGAPIIMSLTVEKWYHIAIEWEKSGSDLIIRACIDGSCTDYSTLTGYTYLNYFNLRSSTLPAGDFYLDDFSLYTLDDIPLDTEGGGSHIEWINPFDNDHQPFETTAYATTSSKTFDLEFEYYLDSTQYATSSTYITYDICPALIPSASCQGGTFASVATADGLDTATTSFTATYAGLHYGYVHFFDASTGNELLTASNIFIVESTSTEPLLNQDYEAIEAQCTTGGFVENGICSVLVFLFYPDPYALQQFVSLKDILDTKIPFAYYYLLNTKLASTTATSTMFDDFDVSLSTSTAYSLGDITLVDWAWAKNIIGEDNLDTIATWFVNIAWIGFGLYVLRRAIGFAQDHL